jgi:hypothetical protein
MNLPIRAVGSLIMVFTSAVLPGSEPRGTHVHILVSHDFGCRATLPVFTRFPLPPVAFSTIDVC